MRYSLLSLLLIVALLFTVCGWWAQRHWLQSRHERELERYTDVLYALGVTEGRRNVLDRLDASNEQQFASYKQSSMVKDIYWLYEIQRRVPNYSDHVPDCIDNKVHGLPGIRYRAYSCLKQLEIEDVKSLRDVIRENESIEEEIRAGFLDPNNKSYEGLAEFIDYALGWTF